MRRHTSPGWAWRCWRRSPIGVGASGGPGAGALVWALVATAPFADPMIGMLDYLKYFRMAAAHGIDGGLLRLNLMFAAVLLLPVAPLLWNRGLSSGGAPALADRLFAAGHVAGVIVATIVGSKPGAGPHHLLPFLPGCAYLAVRAAQSRQSAARSIAVMAMLALTVTHGPVALKQLRSVDGQIVFDEPLERSKAEEVARLYAEDPGAVMGMAETDAYRDTFHRVQGVFHGSPAALLEVPAWMEMEKAGASRAIPEALVTDCAVPSWIIPNRGEPFSLDGGYVHDRPETIVSDRFRALFRANYQPARRGEYYTIWRCSRPVK